MANTAYLTAPLKSTRMPSCIPFIIGNEAAERFSYYGMNAILVPFMTHYMLTAGGAPDHLTPTKAHEWYHTFVMFLYFLPTVGAILADAFLGKYLTILSLSIVYCFGHLALAVNTTQTGLVLGLALIALGAGGIKPCVSANVGDQFGPSNEHLMTRVFSWFYFSINFGATFSTLLVPYLLDGFCAQVGLDPRLGPHFAFGTPGLFMVAATVVFWLGRKKYVHVPPVGRAFLAEATSPEGRGALGRLLILVPFIAVFWAVWYQNFSSWVTQAEKLDRHWLGHEWLPAQIQTVNPLILLLMLPVFSYFIYPQVSRIFPLTPLRKITIGMFLGVVAFLIPAWLEAQITAGLKPSIGWQVLAYVFLTAAEIMVSVTHLEFSYTQAPKKLKSLVMALYLGAMGLGNAFTALVNRFIQNDDGTLKLAGASYFFFFVGVLFVTSLLFIVVALKYRGQTFLQDEVESPA